MERCRDSYKIARAARPLCSVYSILQLSSRCGAGISPTKKFAQEDWSEHIGKFLSREIFLVFCRTVSRTKQKRADTIRLLPYQLHNLRDTLHTTSREKPLVTKFFRLFLPLSHKGHTPNLSQKPNFPYRRRVGRQRLAR